MNFGPILVSEPAARATSLISAPVFSHSGVKALMSDILRANMKLLNNLDSSDDHVFIVRILSEIKESCYLTIQNWALRLVYCIAVLSV